MSLPLQEILYLHYLKNDLEKEIEPYWFLFRNYTY